MSPTDQSAPSASEFEASFQGGFAPRPPHSHPLTSSRCPPVRLPSLTALVDAAPARLGYAGSMIGQSIGNYRVTRLLGEGGMGIVYLAEHPRLGRRAAVKVLHPDLSHSHEMIAALLQRGAGRQRHRPSRHRRGLRPGHAALRHALHRDGVPGGARAWRARIEPGGRLSLRATLEIADQAASALGAAHAQGHRPPRSQARQPLPDARSAVAGGASGSRCSTSGSRSWRSGPRPQPTCGRAPAPCSGRRATCRRSSAGTAATSITAPTSTRWA